MQRHAEEIGKTCGVSAATALRAKPEDVVPAKRATDLCAVCEELRRKRLQVAATKKTVASRAIDEGTCGMARKAFAQAETALSQMDKRRLAPILQDIGALTKHEALHQKIHADMGRCMQEGTEEDLFMIVDWSGALECKSYRQTNYERFNPTTLPMLGAAASIPQAGAQRKLKYLHGYDLRGGDTFEKDMTLNVFIAFIPCQMQQILAR